MSGPTPFHQQHRNLEVPAIGASAAQTPRPASRNSIGGPGGNRNNNFSSMYGPPTPGGLQTNTGYHSPYAQTPNPNNQMPNQYGVGGVHQRVTPRNGTPQPGQFVGVAGVGVTQPQLPQFSDWDLSLLDLGELPMGTNANAAFGTGFGNMNMSGAPTISALHAGYQSRPVQHNNMQAASNVGSTRHVARSSKSRQQDRRISKPPHSGRQSQANGPNLVIEGDVTMNVVFPLRSGDLSEFFSMLGGAFRGKRNNTRLHKARHGHPKNRDRSARQSIEDPMPIHPNRMPSLNRSPSILSNAGTSSNHSSPAPTTVASMQGSPGKSASQTPVPVRRNPTRSARNTTTP